LFRPFSIGVAVNRIKAALKPQFKLHIVGGKIDYSEDRAKSAWMETADEFARAAAVIGVHGGAFGNTLLCPSNATIIEINVPWSPENADGDSK
jgi:hypothetical protein